ncbi:MAG: hypothetical protein HQM12_06770 [SAR324 cluster bacterium]|nr:hypothetical protein [SAR324 cluster bacterium]
MTNKIKDMGQEYQDAVLKGIEALFTLQKQLIESTFEIYEKGLKARETGYEKTKNKAEDLTTLVEKQLSSGQEKIKTTMNKFADKFLPDSKETLEKIEQVVQENLEKVTEQLKKILNTTIDQNIQKTFNSEKELLNKIKEIYDKNISNYHSQVQKLLGGVPEKKSATSEQAPQAEVKKAPVAKKKVKKPVAKSPAPSKS